MSSWILDTAREPARILVRAVAGLILAGAVSTVFWAEHLGTAILTILWALVLFGPVLAWPLVWGRIIGAFVGFVSLGFLAVSLLILQNGNGPASDIWLMLAVILPLLMISLLLAYPMLVVGLVQSRLRR